MSSVFSRKMTMSISSGRLRGGDALEPPDRPQADVQVEDLAQGHVQAAEAAADGGSQRALDTDEVLAESVEGLLGQPVAGLLNAFSPASTSVHAMVRPSGRRRRRYPRAAGQMSTPVPSPSMKGMMGSVGTLRAPSSLFVILSAMADDPMSPAVQPDEAVPGSRPGRVPSRLPAWADPLLAPGPGGSPPRREQGPNLLCCEIRSALPSECKALPAMTAEPCPVRRPRASSWATAGTSWPACPTAASTWSTSTPRSAPARSVAWAPSGRAQAPGKGWASAAGATRSRSFPTTGTRTT